MGSDKTDGVTGATADTAADQAQMEKGAEEAWNVFRASKGGHWATWNQLRADPGSAAMVERCRAAAISVAIRINKAAEAAWTAYSASVGGKSVAGQPLPTWEALNANQEKKHIVAAWRAAAIAVMTLSIDSVERAVALCKHCHQPIVFSLGQWRHAIGETGLRVLNCADNKNTAEPVDKPEQACESKVSEATTTPAPAAVPVESGK